MEPLSSTRRATRRDSPFAPILGEARGVVLDGGLATALEARGHRLDSGLWSARLLVDAPDEIGAVHLTYLEAGADCITTATYQASFEGFARAGFSDVEAVALFERATRLARDAIDTHLSRLPARARNRPLVAASVGPYGAYLADGSEYTGRYGVSRERLVDFHRRRFTVLAESGCDLLACETIPCALEAEVLLDCLADTEDAWAWISFSCRDGAHLADGSPLSEVLSLCASSARLAAIGINCTAPRHVGAWLAAASPISRVPLMAYPNSGERYDPESRSWSEDVDAGWLSSVPEWLGCGARIVGGCCRVGPGEIRRIRAYVDGLGAESP